MICGRMVTVLFGYTEIAVYALYAGIHFITNFSALHLAEYMFWKVLLH